MWPRKSFKFTVTYSLSPDEIISNRDRIFRRLCIVILQRQWQLKLFSEEFYPAPLFILGSIVDLTYLIFSHLSSPLSYLLSLSP